MNSRRIVIHAGFHKTGSTSLQLSAANGRKALLELGVLFPETGYAEWDSPKGKATSGHAGLVASPRRFFLELDAECARLEAEGANIDTVLVSAENLLHPNSTLGLDRLVAFLLKNQDHYDPLLVFTNRDVESLYESHLKEAYSNQGAKILLDPNDFYLRKSNSIKKLDAYKKHSGLKVEILPTGDIFERVSALFGEVADDVAQALLSNHVNSYSSKGSEQNRVDVFRNYWGMKQVRTDKAVVACAYYTDAGELKFRDIEVDSYAKNARYRLRYLVLSIYLMVFGAIAKIQAG